MTYLEDLTIRLATGAAQLPDNARTRHGQWVLAQQRRDGGFAGREGDSDLYYTAFGLRTLMILGLLDGSPAEAAAAFLRGRLGGREGVVDLLSLLMAAKMLELAADIDVFASADPGYATAVAEIFESLRRDDGGYAKSDEGRAGSTYQTFLTILGYQLLEHRIPDAEAAVRFLCSQERPDGGFLEIRVGKRAGVNPTAAAIAALRILQALPPESAERTIDFLADMQSDEGGLTANTRIPLPDVLSTFTGLLTLADLNAAGELQLDRVGRYVQQMERPQGGFAGFALDPSQDVEYTFYAIATLSLLQTV